jgi:hypothetical protein
VAVVGKETARSGMNAKRKGTRDDSGAVSRRRFCKGAALGLGGLRLHRALDLQRAWRADRFLLGRELLPDKPSPRRRRARLALLQPRGLQPRHARPPA